MMAGRAAPTAAAHSADGAAHAQEGGLRHQQPLPTGFLPDSAVVAAVIEGYRAFAPAPASDLHGRSAGIAATASVEMGEDESIADVEDAAPRVFADCVTALRRALHRDCVIVVTVEPCVMCAAAIVLQGVPVVYAGCCNDRFGGCGSTVDLRACRVPGEGDVASVLATRSPSLSFFSSGTAAMTDGDAEGEGQLEGKGKAQSEVEASAGTPSSPVQRPRFTFIHGIYRAEAIAVLQRFYMRGNPNAPDRKRERPLVLAGEE